MLLFLLCCTPGVLCFVVVALLVACSRSVAKASSQCSRSVAVCFLAVFSQCCALHVCQHRNVCVQDPHPGGPQATTRGGGGCPNISQAHAVYLGHSGTMQRTLPNCRPWWRVSHCDLAMLAHAAHATRKRHQWFRVHKWRVGVHTHLRIPAM